MEGEILSVGCEIKTGINVGHRVLFSKWGGTEVTIDGEELLIIKESDILCVLEEGEKSDQKIGKKKPSYIY